MNPARTKAVLAAVLFAAASLAVTPVWARAETAAPPYEAVPHNGLLRAKWASVLTAIDTKDLKDTQNGLKDIENTCAEDGITSDPELSASMIKQGKLLLDAKDFGGAEALFDTAIRISPDYPPAYYAQGWGYFTENRLRVLRAADSFLDGFRKSLDDFWWSFFYAGNKFTNLLFTLAALFSLFGLLAAVRYIPLLAHDVSETIGKPGAEQGVKYLILPGALLAALLVFGWWWAATIVFLLLWVYFNKAEKTLVLGFFALLVFMPEIMANFAVFAGAGGDRLLWVMDDVNKGQIQKGTDEYLQRLKSEEPENVTVLALLARTAKKEQRYDLAADYYNQLAAKDPNSPIYRNNLGNVLFLKGDLDGAVREYKAAIKYGPGRVLPFFNLSQAYGELLMFTEREEADSRARDIDPALVAGLRANVGDSKISMVYDEPVPDRSFWQTAFGDASSGSALADSLWSTTVKLMPLEGAPAAGIGLIVLVISVGALRRKGTYSHYCRKCGKVTCRKCQRPYFSKELCPQCHQIFVKLEGVEARDRVRKMLEVRDRQRKEGLLHRAVSLLLPGAGHFLAGHAIRGFVFMGVFVFFVKDIFFGAFFRTPYDFSLPFVEPDAAMMGVFLVLFYLVAQIDVNRITK